MLPLGTSFVFVFILSFFASKQVRALFRHIVVSFVMAGSPDNSCGKYGSREETGNYGADGNWYPKPSTPQKTKVPDTSVVLSRSPRKSKSFNQQLVESTEAISMSQPMMTPMTIVCVKLSRPEHGGR